MPLSKVVSNSLSLTTLAASGAATLNTLASSGATLTGGTINGMTIGAVTASSVAATTLAASGAATLSSTLGVTGVTTVQAGSVAAPAITTSGDTNTGIFFPAADTIAFSEGGVEAGRFNSSGNFQINNLGLGGTTPSTSGAGITFPATQSASSDANTLDDYEEGTFTPTVQGVSSAGTATYSNQLGAYIKIGNLVYVNVYLIYTSGTGTGQLRVANLPFTSAGSYLPVASVYLDNIAYTANSFVQAILNSNATFVDYYQTNGGGSSAVTYDAAGVLIFSLTYRV